jgi:uncharacterized protein YndB with AHSA1/START domain
MAKITKTIEIEASPEKVFAFTNDLQKRNETSKGWAEAKYLSEGPVGVGTKMHYIGWAAGKRGEWDIEITEFVENKKVVASIVNGGKQKMDDELTFEPTEKGTKLSFYLYYNVRPPVIGSLLDRLIVKKDMEKGMSNMLENMKKVLEA